MHYFSTLSGKELYMIRTDLLSIIRSLNTVFTEIWYLSRSNLRKKMGKITSICMYIYTYIYVYMYTYKECHKTESP